MPLFYVPTVMVISADTCIGAMETAAEILDSLLTLNVRNFDGHTAMKTCVASTASVDWTNLQRRINDTGIHKSIVEEKT